MADIKYFIKDVKESTIYLRFRHGRKIDLKKSTHFKIKTAHWNPDKQEVRKINDAKDKDLINNQLDELKPYLISSFHNDYAKGVEINSAWLGTQINSFFNRRTDSDLNLLIEYFQHFIDKLPYRKNNSRKGKLGVSSSTIQKYENIQRKLEAFEESKNQRFYISDIDLKFESDFIRYLKGIQNLSENTIGRSITFLKTVCTDARDNGIKTSVQLNKVKGFTRETTFITLTPPEIKKIEEHDFSEIPHLDNARDWLIVGLNTGQRVSDFINFTKETIKNNGFLEFKQKKTDAKTIVPLHESVKKVLTKNGGEFPRKISEQKFNTYIKRVSKEVGIDMPTKGKKMNPKTKRKEEGIYPKHELVSSHICRRSFATNHYGRLPTPVLMNITNHSTEKMFLTYIGKTPEDSAKQLQDYWQKLIENETNLTPLKEN